MLFSKKKYAKLLKDSQKINRYRDKNFQEIRASSALRSSPAFTLF